MRGSWRRRCDARAKHTRARKAGDWRVAFRYCRNWAVPGKRRCRLHGGLSTGPKTPAGKAASLAASLPAMLEGRRRRIAELALEGKKINTGHAGGPPPKGRQRPPAGEQQIETQTMAAEQREHDLLSRLMRKVERGGAQCREAEKAYAGVKSDEELIEWAKAALPGLR
jgi:hypothetical protein